MKKIFRKWDFKRIRYLINLIENMQAHMKREIKKSYTLYRNYYYYYTVLVMKIRFS